MDKDRVEKIKENIRRESTPGGSNGIDTFALRDLAEADALRVCRQKIKLMTDGHFRVSQVEVYCWMAIQKTRQTLDDQWWVYYFDHTAGSLKTTPVALGLDELHDA